MPEPQVHHLPRAAHAWIPEAKLRDYCLDVDHNVGGHKARVFEAALGLRRSDWTLLRDQILERVGRSPVTASHPQPPDGVRYTVVIPIDGLNGETRDVVTGWLVEGESAPRLTTAYVSGSRPPGGR